MNVQNNSGLTVAPDAAFGPAFDDQTPPQRSTGVPILLRYWDIVVRRKWVVAAVVTTALLLGLVLTLLTTPLYTATATVEISRQQDQIVNVEGVEPKTEYTDQEFYQTQYALLKARSLAERVASSLKLAERDAFFASFGVDPEADVRARSGGEPDAASLARARAEAAAELLLENVSISPTRGSSLVDVSFTSPDPDLSRQVVNAWTESFIAASLQRRFEATAYARKFLEGRLEQVRQRLEDSERRLVTYAGQQQIISVDSSSNAAPDAPRQERPLIAEDLASLNAELAKATADRIRAESRNASAGGASAEALTNNAIGSLRQQRAEVAGQYASMMSRFEPNYPPAQALASQLQQLDRAIAREEGRVREYLGNSFSEARAREAALKSRVEQLKSGLLDLRRRSIQYNIYQRDVDTNRELYLGLLQRYKEVGVAGGVGTNNIAIVDAALIPDEPSSPKLLSNLLLAMVIGLALAGLLIVALEQIDDAIKNPSDVQRILGLPVLGTVPHAREGEDPRALLRDRKSSVSEAYLSIQTSLQFSTDHGFPRSLAITSTRSGEGKSTSAFALAQMLARTGRRVVLIDGDMRSPSVGPMLELTAAKGLSNFLAGDDDINTMVVSTDVANLTAMLAGPPPPNAAELLTSIRLETLIERLTKAYDHVVIDSPPVLGLADAPLIARRVDGLVYAVETGGARASNIKAAIGRLEASSAPLLGLILTKFDASKTTYGYGYDYGYGYGEAKPD